MNLLPWKALHELRLHAMAIDVIETKKLALSHGDDGYISSKCTYFPEFLLV